MNIYEKIEKLAKQKGYSISALEKECGFGNGLIKKWTNSKPAFDKLQKIADTLKVDVNYLLGRTDSPNSENAPTPPTTQVRPDLKIPEILTQAGISVGFNNGADDITQEELDDMALALELSRKRRK